MTRSCLSVCQKARVSRHHDSTQLHRNALRGPRPAPLRGVVPTGLTALRRWDDQYADRDPGNSPEWDRAMEAIA